jgi:Ni/Co efflux regulator RcnB
MKEIISAVLALTLLGGATAGNAAPFYGSMRGPVFHREAVRYFPRHHVWMRGERFFGGPGFVVVNDWRFFRLRPPPFGFYWVRAGGDFLLVANRGGMIADVIYAPY